MRRWMRLHRYLGALCGPMLLFFAVSGGWQAFRLHESNRDGSYKAPEVLSVASDMHKAERMRGTAGLLFKSTLVLVATCLAVTSLIGMGVALRVAPRASVVWLCFAIGIALPVLLYWLAVPAGNDRPRPPTPPGAAAPATPGAATAPAPSAPPKG